MTQRIQAYGQNPVSEEALRISELAQGTPAMGTGVRPGPNLTDNGGMSKPSVNAQPFNNQRLIAQNASENLNTRVRQGQAAAKGQLTKEMAVQSNAENAAQQMANTRIAEMLYANDAGTATFALGVPEVAARTQMHAAQQKLMAYGEPNLPMASNKFSA